MENGLHVALFCNLTKVFDRVSHKIFRDKVEHYGLRVKALKVLTDFL